MTKSSAHVALPKEFVDFSPIQEGIGPSDVLLGQADVFDESICIPCSVVMGLVVMGLVMMGHVAESQRYSAAGRRADIVELSGFQETTRLNYPARVVSGIAVFLPSTTMPLPESHNRD